jgi:hypothetical protein
MKKSKVKKILTTLLTTATICSMMAATAFATGSTGETSSGSGSTTEIKEISFQKVYTNTNGGMLPDNTFYFTLTPDTSVTANEKTDEGYNVYSGVSLGTAANTSIEFSSNNAANITKADGESKETTTGKFDLSGVTFTAPGAYRYIAEEVIPENEHKSITYDTTKFTVEIIVNTELKPVIARCINKQVKNSSGEYETATVDNAKECITFNNTCKTDGLTIEKKVTGVGSTTQEFDFNIDIPVGDSSESGSTYIELSAGDEIPATIYKKVTGSTTYTETGVTFKVGATDNNFKLADGDYITINNLPEGMIYIITETAVDGYNTTITGVFSSGNTESSKTLKNSTVYDASKKTDSNTDGQDTPIVDGGNTITFTNDMPAPSTGINLNVVPYVAILLIAALGAVTAFVFRRKRAQR